MDRWIDGSMDQGLSGLSGLSADRRMEEGCATHASVHLNPEEHGRHELERGDGMEVGSVQVQRKSWGIGVSHFVDQPSINRCPVVLSPHVLFPHPPTTRFTTTSEQGRGCQSVRELVVGRVVANITLVSGADMSLVTDAGRLSGLFLQRVHSLENMNKK